VDVAAATSAPVAAAPPATPPLPVSAQQLAAALQAAATTATATTAVSGTASTASSAAGATPHTAEPDAASSTVHLAAAATPVTRVPLQNNIVSAPPMHQLIVDGEAAEVLEDAAISQAAVEPVNLTGIWCVAHALPSQTCRKVALSRQGVHLLYAAGLATNGFQAALAPDHLAPGGCRSPS
jgi:hypothetical protein